MGTHNPYTTSNPTTIHPHTYTIQPQTNPIHLHTMSCTSEQLAVLNQKHSATEAGDGMTATIHYGAYKN